MQPARWTLVAVVLGLAATVVAAAPPRGADPAAVAEVESGKRTEALASWWGFDAKESTKALQAAIDSKARKVIVEDMGAPWIVDEIRLRGDLELVFEPGVVVQAKRGAFQGTSASLFTAVKVKNLTLRGPGATLRMWRDDYDDPNQYKKAEWRHVLNLRSCSNVQIIGLTLTESGGDGIYLGVAGGAGPNTNVLIQDVVCDRNYRQGISVISARGLTIERCVLKNTAGTAPMAGIDFEPNHPSEEVADCVMRDCLVENNAGYGYQFYLRPLEASSRPVSVRFERCRSVGNSVGFGLNASPRPGAQPVKGEIIAVDCEFAGASGAGIAIGPKPAEGITARFERCRVVNAAADKPEQAPILLRSGSADVEAVGDVAFVDCVVVDPIDRQPMGYHDTSGGQKLLGVSGSLTVEHAGRRETFALDQKRLDAWFPFQAFRPFPPYPSDGPFAPLDRATTRAEWSCNARQRGRAEWLVWAEAGDEVALTVRVQPVGKGEPPDTPISWISPSGEEKTLGVVKGTLDVAFRATETGAQRLFCEPGSATAAIPRSNRRVALFATRGGSLHLIGYAGDLYFYVPKGTQTFAARVSGDGPGESVKASLRDPAGTVIEQRDNITGHQFLVERPAASAAAVWSLRLERPTKGVLEDIHIQLQGMPPLSATTPDALLKPAR